MKSPTSSSRSLSSAFAALLLAATAATASDWKWTVTPYAWATDVGVDVAIDDRQIVEEEIAFADLLENLETVAQVRVEAQRGAHGVMLDLFDVVLAEPARRVSLPTGADVSLSPEIGMTLFELAGVYDPRGDQTGIAFLYGTRILNQRAEVEVQDLGTAATRTFETDETLVDGLLGVRFVKRLARRWSYEIRADVSAGGTELTWSAGPAVNYAFGRSGRYALSAGYRRMVVDFDSEESLDVDMTLSGFLAGLRMSF